LDFGAKGNNLHKVAPKLLV